MTKMYEIRRGMRYRFTKVTVLPSRAYISCKENLSVKCELFPGQVVPPGEHSKEIDIDPELLYVAPVAFSNGVVYLKLGQWV